jgi:hypothetical protein
VPTYTVHKPDTGMKIKSYKKLASAFKLAYSYLPLDVGSYVKPTRPGAYVAVQEWDDNFEPQRQWLISGRRLPC